MEKFFNILINTSIILAVLAVLVGIPVWLIHERPTTYCTDWTKAISIEPVYEDNGKYEDEQYIVRYEDGSIDGQDQGKIPYARCTNTVKSHHSEADPNWKIVSRWGETEWERGSQ